MAQSNIGYFTFFSGAKYEIDFTNTPVITSEFVDDILRRADHDVLDIKSVYLPNSIVAIDKEAFYKATDLVKVEFESDSNLMVIGDKAFYGCTSLEVFYSPDSLQYIGNEAFYNTRLKEFELSASLHYIGRAAFGNCRELIEASFHFSELEVIPARCFEDCVNLKEVVFPHYSAQHLTVCENAFAGCDNLSVVHDLKPDAFIHPSNKALLKAKIEE